MRFCRWIEQPGHSRWLHETLRATNAVLTQPYQDAAHLAFYGSVAATDEHFVHENGTETRIFAIDELPAFLAGFPEDKWLNFFIAKRVPRDAAIADGAHIASVLADFFNVLLPAYENRASTASGAASKQKLN